jgi:hypothetical protein
MYGNNFISRFRAAFRQADPSTVLSVHKALRFVDRLGSALHRDSETSILFHLSFLLKKIISFHQHSFQALVKPDWKNGDFDWNIKGSHRPREAETPMSFRLREAETPMSFRPREAETPMRIYFNQTWFYQYTDPERKNICLRFRPRLYPRIRPRLLPRCRCLISR